MARTESKGILVASINLILPYVAKKPSFLQLTKTNGP